MFAGAQTARGSLARLSAFRYHSSRLLPAQKSTVSRNQGTSRSPPKHLKPQRRRILEAALPSDAAAMDALLPPSASTSLLPTSVPSAAFPTLVTLPIATRKPVGRPGAEAFQTDSSAAENSDMLPAHPPAIASQSASSVPPRVFQCVMLACLGAFAFGYHISVLNGSLAYILADIGASGSSLVGGWIVSISLALAAVGALLGGLLADAVGRRRALLAVSVPFILGSSISALSSSVPQMLIGRAIVGLAFGVVSCVVPLYISEVSPPSVRGTYGSFNQLSICIGIVAALVAGLPLRSSPTWWRSMFWIGAAPAILLAAGMLLWAPETPAWLQKKGRLAEAQQAEAILAGNPKGSSPGPLRNGSAFGSEVEDALGEREVGMGELFSAKYRKVVGIGMLIFAIQQFAGINAVIYYSSSVFLRVGVTSDIAASALVASANVLGTLASSQLVDTQGRKKLLLLSFSGMGLSMLLLALTLSVPALQPLAGVLSVLGTVAYVLAFAFGAGPVPALLLPEIFPAAIRANGIAVSLMSHWVCNFVIGLSFLGVVEAIGVSGAYLGFAAVCGVGLLFVHFLLPETKGKTLEEIESLFASHED